MENFQLIAPYLANPLILFGFALFLLIGLLKTLINSGITPQLTKKASREVIHKLLLYGFITAVLVILVGFTSNLVEVLVTKAPATTNSPLIPTETLLPFHVGWVLVGYFNPESQAFVDGSYLQLVFRPDETKAAEKTPVIGDVYQITKERNIIIKNYAVDGLRNQYTSPLDILNAKTDSVAILTDADYTGVVLPKNTLVRITESDIGERSPNGLHAVWALVGVCDVDTVPCLEAAQLLED